MISCFAVFIGLLFLIMTYYLETMSGIEYKEWDVDTVTAADFTVEYIITNETWENFKKTPEADHSNLLWSFRQYLKSNFEKIVQEVPGVLSQDKVDIKIQNITFAFHNTKILKLLRKRGKHLTYSETEKAEKYEK